MKKVIGAFLFLCLFALCIEGFSRIYEKKILLKNFPPFPMHVSDFSNFKNFLDWTRNLGYLQDDLYGNPAVDASYVAVANRPGFSSKIKNYELQFDSFGFRGKEITMPKPKNTFRIFVLGGSTVVQGINSQGLITENLEETLKKRIPQCEVINAGVAGYASQNELLLLETKILKLQPDLVVVLDGRNDLFYASEPSLTPYHQTQLTLDALINRPTFISLSVYTAKWLFHQSVFLKLLSRRALKKIWPRVYAQHVVIHEQDIQNYLADLTMIKTVLEANRIPGLILFQPTMGYGKKYLTPYEQSSAEYLKEAENSDWLKQVPVVWPSAGKRVKRLPASRWVKFYDLSAIFENFKETAYMDSCHYTPEGTRQIALKTAALIQRDFINRGSFDTKRPHVLRNVATYKTP